MTREAGPRGARVPAWLGAVALFALAFAARCLVFPRVFAGDRILTAGNDPYYHFRRILYTAQHFPASLDFDPYLNFPAGGQPIWGPWFDLAVASVVALLAPDPTAADVERISIWVPPVLGAVAVVAAWAVARRFFGPAAGWVAGLVLCVLPMHVWYSQLSFVDHHVAVAALSAGLLGSGLGIAARALAGDEGRRALAFAALHGVLLGTALLVWPGALLHAGLLAALGFGGLALAERDEAARASRSLAVASLVACALVAPYTVGVHSARFGGFTPVVLSSFQPWFFGVLAAFHAACALLWARTAAGASRTGRIGSALALGVALLLATALASDAFVSGIGDALAWFGKRETFQAHVSESKSILYFGGRKAPSLMPALRVLSGVFVAAPLLAWLVFARARGRRERALALGVGGWALAWLGAALLQSRFANSASVALALLAGAAFASLAGRGSGRRVPVALLAVALGVLLLPIRGNWARVFDDLARHRRGESPRYDPVQRTMALASDMAGWMVEHTPPTAGFDDAVGEPEYGVFTGANEGHLMLWRARRPMVVGSFGDDLGEENFELLFEFASYGEDEAWEALAARRIRYVVSPGGETRARAPQRVSVLFRDHPLRSGRVGSGVLRRHRLVYESAPLQADERAGSARFRVFERVAGARIAGRGEPGETVRATLDLTARGIARRYAADTTVADEGAWELVVPYATGQHGTTVATADAFAVECGGERHALAVTEEAVLAGATVAGPDCAQPAARP